MPLVSILGDKAFLAILCVLLVILGRKSLRRNAGLALFSFLGGAVSVTILKKIVCRLRPSNVLDNVHLLNDVNILSKGGHSNYSFPSGHAALVFAVAVIFAAKYPRYKIIFLSVGALVCFSRVYMGLHYPSDVLGGALLGASVALSVLWIEKKIGGENVRT